MLKSQKAHNRLTSYSCAYILYTNHPSIWERRQIIYFPSVPCLRAMRLLECSRRMLWPDLWWFDWETQSPVDSSCSALRACMLLERFHSAGWHWTQYTNYSFLNGWFVHNIRLIFHTTCSWIKWNDFYEALVLNRTQCCLRLYNFGSPLWVILNPHLIYHLQQDSCASARIIWFMTSP